MCRFSGLVSKSRSKLVLTQLALALTLMPASCKPQGLACNSRLRGHAFEPPRPPQLREAKVWFGRHLTTACRLKRANELSVRSATEIL
jgi:hypothetical protein